MVALSPVKLAYVWPAEWTIATLSVSLMEIRIDESFVIRHRPSIPLPAGVVTWVTSVMTEDLPTRTRAREVRNERAESTFGWPVVISEYAITDEGGEIVEQRLGVFYRLLYNGGEVVVRSRDRARFHTEAPALRERFLAGHVRWPRDRVGTLYDLTQ